MGGHSAGCRSCSCWRTKGALVPESGGPHQKADSRDWLPRRGHLCLDLCLPRPSAPSVRHRVTQVPCFSWDCLRGKGSPGRGSGWVAGRRRRGLCRAWVNSLRAGRGLLRRRPRCGRFCRAPGAACVAAGVRGLDKATLGASYCLDGVE
jgi:hypothetical protein